jgi:glycosyltransferase involved in cell wall biosynthesis
MSTSRPIALAHDYLLVMRGAERTFAAIADCWPDAPIFTLLHDRDATRECLPGRVVYTSPLQRSGVAQDGFRRLLPLFPAATRRLPTHEYDVIVSSSSAFAHGAPKRADAVHLCYCHSPFRYAWFETERALSETPRAVRLALRGVLARHRRFDRAAAREVTQFVANSEITRERIQRYWNRDARVIHPPVDVDRFRIGPQEDYFIFVGELVCHKRVDAALEAARRAGRPLRVVGTGPERERLEAEYGTTATFLGRVDDDELTELYANALAAVMPNVEEFGIAAVEAQAAGRPVLAADAGGARETVVEGVTGVRVPVDDVDALAEAMRHVDFTSFSPTEIAEHAQRFSRTVFQQRIADEVTRLAGAPVRTKATVAPTAAPDELALRPAT